MLEDVIIRTCTDSDIEGFVKFYNKAHADVPGHSDISLATAREHIFDQSQYDHLGHILAISNNEIVGSAKGERFKGHVGSVSILLLSGYRQKGIRKMLLDRLIDYCKSVGITELRSTIYAKDDRSVKFYLENGFKEWKYEYLMRCDTNVLKTLLQRSLSGYDIRPVKFEDNKFGIIYTLNAAFTGHDNPVLTAKQLEDMITGFSETKFFGAFRKDNEMTGIIICVRNQGSIGLGYVHMLGVLPSDRNKGLGKALLVYVLSWFKENGIVTVELNVDLDSPAALKLYENSGFKAVSETIILRRFIT